MSARSGVARAATVAFMKLLSVADCGSLQIDQSVHPAKPIALLESDGTLKAV